MAQYYQAGTIHIAHYSARFVPASLAVHPPSCWLIVLFCTDAVAPARTSFIRALPPGVVSQGQGRGGSDCPTMGGAAAGQRAAKIAVSSSHYTVAGD